jgi:creatinine amidohydrolase
MGNDLPSTNFRTVKFKGVEIEINRPTKSATDNGWVGVNHPGNSSAKFGEEILTAVSDYIVNFIEVFKRAKLPPLA